MEDWTQIDAAVVRLGESLERLPFDRALPDLPALLRIADVPASLFTEDERARKLLHEAVLARPLSTTGEVGERRAEVEVLLIELGLLTTVLDGAGRDDPAATAARQRLTTIRARVEELRADL